MEALTLLREQASFAERLFADVFRPVTVEQAIWRPEGSKANQVAALFLHAYTSQDRGVHGVKGTPTVFESGGWSERLSYDPNAAWKVIEQPDLAAYRAYAADVTAATKALLDTADPATLEREIESSRGKRTGYSQLSLVLITHKLTHMGKIAALLGCQGVKGFPF
jgi:hypothetical protein